MNASSLINFSNINASEKRLQDAIANTEGDEKIILVTQLARCYGLRQDFKSAQEILEELRPQLSDASAEANARFALEWGRTLCSTTHNHAEILETDRSEARESYLLACDFARRTNLDDVTIDALHMMAVADNTPEQQLLWGQSALDVMLASTQPDVKRWEASLHNNIGYALHQLGKYGEALGHFELALAARKRSHDPQQIRVAEWMIAWTLRSLERLGDARAIQERLEAECDAAGQPDLHVYNELMIIHGLLGFHEKAKKYEHLSEQLQKK